MIVRLAAPSHCVRLTSNVRGQVVAHPALKASVTAVLLFVSTSAPATGTLCTMSEEIVFSCPISGGKTVSVCASSLNDEKARIAYRFGTLKDVELELVNDASRRGDAVEYNEAVGARGYDLFVRFRSGDYGYVVQQRWDGCPRSADEHCKGSSFFAGVTVYKAGRRLNRHECEGARRSLNLDPLKRLNVPTSGSWPK